MSFFSLPHGKILDWSKLRAFAYDKMNVTEALKFGFGRVENIVRKGFFNVVKSRDCVVKS